MPEQPLSTPQQELPQLPFLERLLPGGVITLKQKRLGIGLVVGIVLVVVAFSSNSGPSTPAPTVKPSVINQPDASVMPQKVSEVKRLLDQQTAVLTQQQQQVKQAQALAQAQINPATGQFNQPTTLQYPGQNPQNFQQPPYRYEQQAPTSAKHRGPASLIIQDLRHGKEAPSLSANAAATAGDLYKPVASTSRNFVQPVQLAAASEDASQKKRDSLAFDPSLPTMILPEGTVIESVLTNEIAGAYQGPVNCMVSTNVYAPGTRTLLIPQGSRILGEATAVNSLNQQRLAVTFHGLLIQNGASFFTVSLDRQLGLDQAGGSGLRDQVNNHLASTLGISLAVGGIAGLAQIGNSQSGFGVDPTASFRNGVTQNVSQSSVQILDRLLNRQPTITIRPGTRTKILLVGNVVVPVFPGASQ